MTRASESTLASRLPALAMLLFGGAVIGLAPILVRWAAAGPAAAGFWRLTLALPVLALIARPWTPGAGGEGGQGPFPKIVLVAGVMFALDLAFWHYGIAFTSVANATVLTNLTPVVVTALAWIVFRERPGGLFLAAVALAVFGAGLLAMAHPAAHPLTAQALTPAGGVHSLTGGPALTPHAVNPPLGDALSLITAFWYALYLLCVGRARRTLGPTRVMFWSTLVAAPLMLFVTLAFGEPLLPTTSWGWLACLGLAAVHVAGQGSIAWALGRLPTATASMVVLIQPVVAALLGWWWLHEALGVWQTVGGAIALTGVVLSQWASARRAAAA